MSQLFAMLRLRWRLTVRSLGKGPGHLIEFIAKLLLFLAFLVIALGAGVGAGVVAAMLIAQDRQPNFRVFLHMLFVVSFLVGFFMPLLDSVSNASLDARRYLLYPISMRRLYAVQFLTSAVSTSHILYLPAFLGAFLGAYAFTGFSALPALCIFVLYYFAVVAWSQTAIALLQVALRARRMRELVGLAGFTVFIIWWFFHVRTFSGVAEDIEARMKVLFHTFIEVDSVFPSGWAAEGLYALRYGDAATAWWGILGLSALAAAGLYASYRAFAFQCYAVGTGGGPSEIKEAGTSRFVDKRLPLFHNITSAIFWKELRYIFRSAAGKYNFVILPVFVGGIGFLFGTHLSKPIWGLNPVDLAFPGLLFYASLMTNNMVLNAFAWEGGGVQSYFLSPVSLRRVLLGKNLAFWLYTTMVTAISVLVLLLFVIRPGALILITGVELFAILMFAYALCGNLTSVLQPVRRDMSNIWKNAAQGTGVLAVCVSAAGVFFLYTVINLVLFILEMRALLPVALLGLALLFAGAYVSSLGPMAALMERRREKFISALTEKVQ